MNLELGIDGERRAMRGFQYVHGWRRLGVSITSGSWCGQHARRLASAPQG